MEGTVTFIRITLAYIHSAMSYKTRICWNPHLWKPPNEYTHHPNDTVDGRNPAPYGKYMNNYWQRNSILEIMGNDRIIYPLENHHSY